MPNESPEVGVIPLPAFREPKSMDYILWVDLYDLACNMDLGKDVKVEIKWGDKCKRSKYAF